MHPGELVKSLMNGRKATEVAESMGISKGSLSNLVNEKLTLTVDMALLLEGEFGLPAIAWLCMQDDHNIKLAKTVL